MNLIGKEKAPVTAPFNNITSKAPQLTNNGNISSNVSTARRHHNPKGVKYVS